MSVQHELIKFANSVRNLFQKHAAQIDQLTTELTQERIESQTHRRFLESQVQALEHVVHQQSARLIQIESLNGVGDTFADEREAHLEA